MGDDTYKVELETYNGPLDLLLYLIRRDEVDIYDIPIARLTAQYLAYVEVLTELDPDHVAEFLVMAASLMEIKSRLLLPKPPPEESGEESFEDPRLELVHRLLEYKRFKDAAQQLGTAADERAARFGRVPVLPAFGEPAVDLDNVQVWDLLSAFSKLITQIGKTRKGHQVVYDDTPISLHATDIIDWLERSSGSGRFDALFEAREKSQIIGLFLALLELIRAKRVRAEQEAAFDTIVLHLIDATPLMESEIDSHLRGVSTPEPPAADQAPPISATSDAEQAPALSHSATTARETEPSAGPSSGPGAKPGTPASSGSTEHGPANSAPSAAEPDAAARSGDPAEHGDSASAGSVAEPGAPSDPDFTAEPGAQAISISPADHETVASRQDPLGSNAETLPHPKSQEG